MKPSALGRAGYYVGHQPWSGTVIDDLAGKYKDDGRTLRCDSHDTQSKCLIMQTFW